MTRNERVGAGGGFTDGNTNTVSRRKFGHFLHSDPIIPSPTHHDEGGAPGTSPGYHEGASTSGEASPFSLSPTHQLSPWNNAPSPYARSPWVVKSPPLELVGEDHCLPVGSIVREEGHIYSLAASGGLLYTGSDSKNIRVWRGLREYSGFKSGSGLVKAIVVAGERIFTGHQDGKIRVWKASSTHPAVYRRIGNLPTTVDSLRSSMNPRNYVQVRRNRNVLRIRHYDTVSCLSLDRERGLLYSGSWDKTVKVWRASDFKFLESIAAHNDAVNSVVAGFDDLVFTGSADGTVKAWRRELQGREVRHFMVQLLVEQEAAVTALAVSTEAAAVYCGSSAGLVSAWEREKQRLSHCSVLRGHKLAVLCLAVAGSLVFSGSADKSICVWRRDGGGVHSCLSVLTGHSGPVKCLAVEKDLDWGGTAAVNGGRGRRWSVYSGSLDKSVKVWKVAETAAGAGAV